MTDIAEHESRFHDQGEHVDDPYPQMSEHPLRAGVGKITDATSAPVYVFNEQVWTGAAWANGTAPGQYVGVEARDFNSDTSGSADDLVLFWEQYTQDGVIEIVCAIGAVGGAKVEFGKPTSEPSSASFCLTLDPCDANGNDNGLANVTVLAAGDQSEQPIEKQGWTTSTVLAFLRFSTVTIQATTISGVLLAEWDADSGTASTPAVMLPTGFETEAAQTDSWDRDNPPAEKDGVQVRHTTRIAYDYGSDEILYAFYRTFTYDSRGQLLTISAETRVTVETPESCE